MKVIIVSNDMIPSVKNIKLLDESKLYKACLYKSSDSFELVREWSNFDGNNSKVNLWCKISGVKSLINDDLSNLLGKLVYSKSVFCLLKETLDGVDYVDFEMNVWNYFLNKCIKVDMVLSKDVSISNKLDNSLKLKNEDMVKDVDGVNEVMPIEEMEGEEGEEEEVDEEEVDEEEVDEEVEDGDEGEEEGEEEEGEEEEGVRVVLGKCDEIKGISSSDGNSFDINSNSIEMRNELMKELGLFNMDELSDEEYLRYSDEEEEA